MGRCKKLGGAFVCTLCLALVGIVWALFRGYFDHGQFEVEHVDWWSLTPERVAFVAKRSDRQAMSSDVYFVLVANHVFSPTELRRAYYRDEVIFAAANDCLSVHWSTPNKLEVICDDGVIDPSHVEVCKRKAGDVSVRYVNITDGKCN